MNNPIKFLLINPTAPQWRVQKGQAPRRSTRVFRFSMLSSLYVTASMPPQVTSRILDEDLEPVDYDTDADLIGISFMTYNAPRAYEIADTFRREKGKTVIFGGYHPSFMPEEAIQHADAVCIGEAEACIPEMIADFQQGNLKPFYRQPLATLDDLPELNRGGLNRSFYMYPDAVQATRGCRQGCRFCSIAAFFNRTFRARPVERVIEELEGLSGHLVFMDDNIMADTEYTRELFTRMMPLQKRWYSQCCIKIAEDRELLELAHRSGCRGLFIGFESLSQANLARQKKDFQLAQDYAKAIEKIHRAGIGVFAGIVFGFDEDDETVFDRTLRFLEDTRVDALQATILTPFPGTALYDEMEQQGRIVSKDWSMYDFAHVVFEPQSMSAQTLQRGHARVLEEFYAKQATVRRLWRSYRTLKCGTLLRAVLPLNAGYHYRLKSKGFRV